MKKDECPKCKADLGGGEIPEAIRENYSPPYRWSRKIAMYGDKDRTVAYQCPDCGHEWPREQGMADSNFELSISF